MAARRTRSSLLRDAEAGPSTHSRRYLEPPPAAVAGMGETMETLGSVRSEISAADLPQRYIISVALPPGEHQLPVHVAKRRRIEGEEALTDAIRRSGDAEGRLDALRQVQHVRRRTDTATGSPAAGKKGKEKMKNDAEECMWHTASLKFPCTCQLQDLPHILSPARPPPLVAELDALPPHPQPRQIPIRPDALQSWARAEPAIDLDPAMDEMREFEIGWRAADGTCGRLVAGRAYDAIESGNNGRKGALVDATPTMSGVDRKGKGRAMDIDMADPCGAVDGDEGEMGRAQAVALPQPNGDSDAPAATAVPAMTISEQSVHTAESWEEEAKRRKAVWRARICADPGYDSVFSILPLPHSIGPIPPPYVKADQNTKRVPHNTATALSAKPFILPKYFALPFSRRDPSPYHPDISRFTIKAPGTRVYWLIPVHGPVLIPSLDIIKPSQASAPRSSSPAGKSRSPEPSVILSQFGDTQASSSSATNPPIPIPSVANISDVYERPIKVVRPAPVRWTPALLSYFWTEFLLQLQKDPVLPLGSISLAVSGPKPDPFIALRPSKPLDKHLLAGKTLSSDGQEGQISPVRVEAGDHIRVYCDAAHALRLRTWLYGIEVDIAAIERKAAARAAKDGAGAGETLPPGAAAESVPPKQVARSINDKSLRTEATSGLMAKANDLRRAVLVSRKETERDKGKAGARGGSGESVPKAEKLVKVFDKARLTLVGPRGEVLIVA